MNITIMQQTEDLMSPRRAFCHRKVTVRPGGAGMGRVATVWSRAPTRWVGRHRVFQTCTIRACGASGRTSGPQDHGMAIFVRHNRRLPLLGCMIMVIVFAVVGVIVLVGVVVTVLAAGDGSSSTGGV